MKSNNVNLPNDSFASTIRHVQTLSEGRSFTIWMKVSGIDAIAIGKVLKVAFP